MHGCYGSHGGTLESALNEMSLEQSDKDFFLKLVRLFQMSSLKEPTCTSSLSQRQF